MSETVGLLVILKAKEGKEEDLEDFLNGGLELVNQEPRTLAWFAFKIDHKSFGIYDTFQAELGRTEHLKGEVAKGLLANATTLLEDFDASTSIQKVDVIARNHKEGLQNKGLLVVMEAKKDKIKDVEKFLNVGKELVSSEPDTLSWYALRLPDNKFAIFDTFKANSGRKAHLEGAVAKALLTNAPELLVDFQTSAIQKIDVLANKNFVPKKAVKAQKTVFKKTEKIGLLVTIKAKKGKEEDVEKMLLGGLGLVNEEVKTISWFAFKIDASTFGIFDTFETEFGRQAHLKGHVVKTLLNSAETMFEDFSAKTSVEKVDMIVTNHKSGEQNKGLLVIIKAKSDKVSDVEAFLNVGKDLVTNEPETLSWYAIKLSDNRYAIFDTFQADKGRDAHLTGAVAKALLENAPKLLVDFKASDIQKTDILAAK